MLSERGESEKATYYMIPTIWYSGKEKKTIETVKKKSMVSMGSGGGSKGWMDGAQGVFRAVKLLCIIL